MMAALIEGRHDHRLAREHSSLLTQILIWHYYYYCQTKLTNKTHVVWSYANVLEQNKFFT